MGTVQLSKMHNDIMILNQIWNTSNLDSLRKLLKLRKNKWNIFVQKYNIILIHKLLTFNFVCHSLHAYSILYYYNISVLTFSLQHVSRQLLFSWVSTSSYTIILTYEFVNYFVKNLPRLHFRWPVCDFLFLICVVSTIVVVLINRANNTE